MRDAAERWKFVTASWKDRSTGLVRVPHLLGDGYHELVSWGHVNKSKSLTACRYPMWRWHLLICNNPDCPGELWVREDRFVEAMESLR